MPFRLSRSQRLVLEHIRNHGGVSRSELTSATGLSAGALSRLIRELLDSGLIKEGKRVPIQRGQPRLPLLLNAEAVWSIGISFSLYDIEIVAIDFGGEPVAVRREPLPKSGADDIFGRCAALVNDVLRVEGAKRPSPCGVGLALPGYFQPTGSHHIRPPAPLAVLADFDLSHLGAVFGHQTWVENNSTAAALAEFYHRPDSAVESLTVINVGFGFSAGFIVGSRLYRGRGGNAGEIGRIYPRGTPRPSVLDLIETLRAEGIDISSTADLSALSDSPDETLRIWIGRAGAQLAHAIDIVDFITAPDDIVLGGQVPEALARMLFEEITARHPEGAPARLSRLVPLAAAHGAAFLPIYNTFSPFG